MVRRPCEDGDHNPGYSSKVEPGVEHNDARRDSITNIRWWASKQNTNAKNSNVTTIRQPERIETDGPGRGRRGVHAERTQ